MGLGADQRDLRELLTVRFPAQASKRPAAGLSEGTFRSTDVKTSVPGVRTESEPNIWNLRPAVVGSAAVLIS
jgi:hypothetical protein